MAIQRIDPGPRMSSAVIHGDTIYVAGKVASDAAKGRSVTEQTRDILGQIEAVLAQCGSDKSKIVSTTIYLSDIKTFGEMNAVWDGWVSPGNPPARATVEAKLAAPEYTVEIVVVAGR
jgi:enamine deaminase RidA (YjgF/YER057c/UK114 family)